MVLDKFVGLTLSSPAFGSKHYRGCYAGDLDPKFYPLIKSREKLLESRGVEFEASFDGYENIKVKAYSRFQSGIEQLRLMSQLNMINMTRALIPLPSDLTPEEQEAFLDHEMERRYSPDMLLNYEYTQIDSSGTQPVIRLGNDNPLIPWESEQLLVGVTEYKFVVYDCELLLKPFGVPNRPSPPTGLSEDEHAKQIRIMKRLSHMHDKALSTVQPTTATPQRSVPSAFVPTNLPESVTTEVGGQEITFRPGAAGGCGVMPTGLSPPRAPSSVITDPNVPFSVMQGEESRRQSAMIRMQLDHQRESFAAVQKRAAEDKRIQEEQALFALQEDDENQALQAAGAKHVEEEQARLKELEDKTAAEGAAQQAHLKEIADLKAKEKALQTQTQGKESRTESSAMPPPSSLVVVKKKAHTTVGPGSNVGEGAAIPPPVQPGGSSAGDAAAAGGAGSPDPEVADIDQGGKGEDLMELDDDNVSADRTDSAKSITSNDSARKSLKPNTKPRGELPKESEVHKHVDPQSAVSEPDLNAAAASGTGGDGVVDTHVEKDGEKSPARKQRSPSPTAVRRKLFSSQKRRNRIESTTTEDTSESSVSQESDLDSSSPGVVSLRGLQKMILQSQQEQRERDYKMFQLMQASIRENKARNKVTMKGIYMVSKALTMVATENPLSVTCSETILQGFKYVEKHADHTIEAASTETCPNFETPCRTHTDLCWFFESEKGLAYLENLIKMTKLKSTKRNFISKVLKMLCTKDLRKSLRFDANQDENSWERLPPGMKAWFVRYMGKEFNIDEKEVLLKIRRTLTNSRRPTATTARLYSRKGKSGQKGQMVKNSGVKAKKSTAAAADETSKKQLRDKDDEARQNVLTGSQVGRTEDEDSPSPLVNDTVAVTAGQEKSISHKAVSACSNPKGTTDVRPPPLPFPPPPTATKRVQEWMNSNDSDSRSSSKRKDPPTDTASLSSPSKKTTGTGLLDSIRARQEMEKTIEKSIADEAKKTTGKTQTPSKETQAVATGSTAIATTSQPFASTSAGTARQANPPEGKVTQKKVEETAKQKQQSAGKKSSTKKKGRK